MKKEMINKLTVTQLVENTVGAPGLLAEHGVALVIEAEGDCLRFAFYSAGIQ